MEEISEIYEQLIKVKISPEQAEQMVLDLLTGKQL